MKNTIKSILNRKYHLHLLTIPLGILLIHLADQNFLHLKEAGNFMTWFLVVFLSFSLGFLVEWVQGAFFGANGTPAELKESNLDILISGLGGFIAVFIGDNLLVGGIYIIFALVLEAYRRNAVNNL